VVCGFSRTQLVDHTRESSGSRSTEVFEVEEVAVECVEGACGAGGALALGIESGWVGFRIGADDVLVSWDRDIV